MRKFQFLAFRADPITGAAIRAAAEASGASLSGWLRESARLRLPEVTTLPALPPSPRRRPVHVPDATAAAVARLAGDVAKMTGATIQFAKALREVGCVPEHEAAESILRNLRVTQSHLVRIVDRLRAGATE
jgi:hypothetical protein